MTTHQTPAPRAVEGEATHTAPAVVGLDLSITATGIADRHGDTRTVKGPADHGDRRLLAIVAEIDIAVDFANLVVIEDLPTHAHGAGVTGMVHGAVRAALLTWGVPYVLVPPASLKRYATGRGNCGKPEMAVALYKRLGLELADDNQVDAAWLRAMGLDALRHPLVTLPASHRQALAAINYWPEAPA